MFRHFIDTALSRGKVDTNAAIANIYSPIIRGYFGVAAAYYVIMSVTHFGSYSGSNLAIMATVSITASVLSVAAWHFLRKTRSIRILEVLTSLVNILVLSNVIVAMHMEYAQPKLIYFMMMVMIFGFACVSMRQALLSVGVTLAALFFELYQHDPAQVSIYGFIAFAAGLSAIAITFFLRRAIGLAVNQKSEAEARLNETAMLGEKMRQQSLTDSLTGLPNRRGFFETMKKYKKVEEGHEIGWLMVLDLDGFKAVNDVYGHIMGDELLKAVSRRLREYCGENAHVSRMGGDEFNIIYWGDRDDGEVKSWCDNLLTEISRVYQIEDRLIQISGSIGCHLIVHDKSGTELIRDADYALLHAKKHGKNRVVVFREEHAQDSAERHKIEQALRVADFGSEIELLFQPQFDLVEERFVRAEALARWNSPALGQISPERFIKIAEESGLIAKITLAVLAKTIEVLKGSLDPIPLAINLSGHDLLSDQIIDQIITMSQDSGLNPELIEFEVTETAMLVDTEKASANMLRLSELGHALALDDFGTGYSNFNYLRSLPIKKLKIDRSFMEDLGDPMTEKILRSLSGMASTLDVKCLFEGIENELALLMAKRVGAQSVQGYLFGKPMSSTELRAYFGNQQSAKVAATFARAEKQAKAKPVGKVA